MRIRNRVRDKITGIGANLVSVTIRLNNGGATVDTPDTDPNGLFDYQQNGSPGVVEWLATHQGETKIVGGDASAQFDGICTGELVELFTVLGNGVISNYKGELAVTPGTGLQVLVADGVSLHSGFAYVGYTNEAVAITANASGNPRIDLIVARIYAHPSDNTRGKAEIVAIEGTPAPAPVAPAALNESAGLHRRDVVLAELAVANGAASFVAGNITDKRTYAPGPLLDGSVTFEKIAPADIGMNSGQLAEGSHRHIADSERNLLVDGDTQPAADTPDTTNLAAQGTVGAMTFPLTLGVAGSTWTVQAEVAASLRRDTEGQSFIAAEIDGVENGINQNIEAEVWTRVEHEYARAGIPGNQTIQIRCRYRGTDSGRTYARNPRIRIVAKRTA